MKNRLQAAAGLCIGTFLLWFLFRGTDWAKVWDAARAADPAWMLACILFILASFFVRVQRWSYIVRTAKPATFSSLFHATQIGFLANFVLPLRMGEPIRALVLARLVQLPFTKCFAFVALDRVTDLVGLAAMMFIATLAYAPEGPVLLPPEIYAHPIPADAVRRGALSVAAAIALFLACFAAFYFVQGFAVKAAGALAPLAAAVLRALAAAALLLPGIVLPAKVAPAKKKLHTLLGPDFPTRIQRLVLHFAEGMHIFRSTPQMLKTIFFAVLTWLLLTGSYYSMLRAFDLDVPWFTPFLVITMLSLMISMPGAPGFIGQFHAGIVAGIYLAAPAMTQQPDTVKAVALVTHILHTLPVLAVGLYSLYATQFGLLELRREGELEVPR